MAEFPPDKPEKTLAVEEMETKKADHAKTIEEEEARTEEVTEHSMLRTESVTSGEEEEVRTEEITENLLDCDTIHNLNTENKESSEEGNKNPGKHSINKNPIDGTDSLKKCLEALFANVENKEEYIQMQLDKAKSEIEEIMSQVRDSNRNNATNQTSTDGGSQNTSQQNSPMANQVMPMPSNLEQNYFNHPYGMMYPPQEGFMIQAPMMPMPSNQMMPMPSNQMSTDGGSQNTSQQNSLTANQVMPMPPNLEQNYFNHPYGMIYPPQEGFMIQAPMMPMPIQMMYYYPPQQQFLGPESDQLNQMGMVPYFIPYQAPMMYQPHHFISNMAPNGWPGSFVVDQNYYNQAPFPNAAAEAPWPELNQQRQQRQPQRQRSRRDNGGNSSRQGQYPQQYRRDNGGNSSRQGQYPQQPRRDNHGNSSRQGRGQYPQQRPR